MIVQMIGKMTVKMRIKMLRACVIKKIYLGRSKKLPPNLKTLFLKLSVA